MAVHIVSSAASLPWTDQQIRELCHEHSSTTQLSEGPYFHVDQYYIKWGATVNLDEALAQQYVWENTPEASFRVPKVYHYFEDQESPLTYGRCGYLVMEYIPEDNDEFIDPNLLRKALLELWKIPTPAYCKLGPFAGGLPRGYLWADNGSPVRFTSIQRMEKCMDKCARISCSQEATSATIDLGRWPTAIVHGDFARRNVRLVNGTLFILDWGFAGVYPIAVDSFALDFLVRYKGETYLQKLQQIMPAEFQLDEELLSKLYCVYKTLMVYNLRLLEES